MDAWEESQETPEAELAEYSRKAINYMKNPRNAGMIAGADAHVSVWGSCGDNMQIWLKVKGGKVENASFWTDGCGATIACGGMVTELARGKALRDALAVSAEDIVKALDGLPEDHVHCAGLAALALKKAILEFMAYQREPWKKLYGKGG